MTELQKPEDLWDVYNSSNDQSLVTKLQNCQEFLAQVRALPPHLIGCPEKELRKGFRPDDMLERLKISFWDEFRLSQNQKRPMMMQNVLNGLCSKPYFYEKVVKDKLKLAWLITPPPEEILVQKQLIQIGLKRLQEVLELPVIEVTYRDLKGKQSNSPRFKTIRKVNVPLIKEIRGIVEMLQNRVYGSVIQKQQIESKTLAVNLTDKELPGGEPTVADLEKALKKLTDLEKRAKTALPEVETVEGEVTSEEA